MLILALILFTTAFGVVSCLKEDTSSNSVQQIENTTNPSSSEEASSRSELSAAFYKLKVEVLEMSNVETGVFVCVTGVPTQCNATTLLVTPNAGCGSSCAAYPTTTTLPSSIIKSTKLPVSIVGVTANNCFGVDYQSKYIILNGTPAAKIVLRISTVTSPTSPEVDSRIITLTPTTTVQVGKNWYRATLRPAPFYVNTFTGLFL